jgi:hypothetical protein
MVTNRDGDETVTNERLPHGNGLTNLTGACRI